MVEIFPRKKWGQRSWFFGCHRYFLLLQIEIKAYPALQLMVAAQYASQDPEDKDCETLEPSETQAETGNETQTANESQKRGGAEWKAWEDQALANEVTATKGETVGKWEEEWSRLSCKSRFQSVSTTMI